MRTENWVFDPELGIKVDPQDPMYLQYRLKYQSGGAKQPSQGEQVQNAVSNAVKNKIKNEVVSGVTGSGASNVSSATSSLGSSSYNLGDYGITGNLFGDYGASSASSSYIPSSYSLSDAGISGNLAKDAGLMAPGSVTPGVSDAAALGSNIGSGLQSVGVGAQTAGAIGSFAGNAIPIAGGLYGAYNLSKNLMDNRKDAKGGAMAGAATGAAIGSFIPGIGTVIGGLIGAAVGGGAGGLIGGDKGKDQLSRDGVRKGLKKIGFVGQNNDWALRNPDGTSFDIGKDGNARIKDPSGRERRQFEVDFSNPRASQVVGYLDPLAGIMTGEDEKLRSAFSGYLTNSALMGADAKSNARSYYDRLGVNKEGALRELQKLRDAKKIDENRYSAYNNSLNLLFGDEKPQTPSPSNPTLEQAKTNWQKPGIYGKNLSRRV
jgi:hypothetical protein